jgi:vancomycin resistance protein YoaR
MSRTLRIAIIVAATPLILAVWATVVFAMDRASNGGEILGRVSVAGVELGGLTEAEARQALQGLETDMTQTPIVFEVEGTQFQLLPSQIGFNLDEDAIITAAMDNGRSGGLAGQFRWWLGHLGSHGEATVALAGTWDPAALEPYLDDWEVTAIADPPFEGGVTVRDGHVIPESPEPGTGIDREATVALVDAAMLDLRRQAITVPTTQVTPILSLGEVGTAVAEAQRLINGPVVLSRLNPEVTVTFPASLLASALRSDVVGSRDDPQIQIYLDQQTLVDYLQPQRDQIEFPPEDAQIVIRPDDTPTIIPGRAALLVDDDKLAAAVQGAAASATRAGAFPYKEGDDPDFTTQDAEDLGIRELISYHGEDVCCTTFYTAGGTEQNQNRVSNIHLMADLVNGAIVMPGETFDINKYVGPRTIEKGFNRAGAIIGDIIDCCDDPANVGGGVSQFSTTLYNAVFWSGLEDVEHTPHTLYISRYPEGIEATLGYPEPDLVFRNNTDNAVYIKTEYTDDSITVKLFGDNGGIKVDMQRGDRTYYTEPGEHYDADATIPPGEQKVTSEGSPGWTITVYRTITYPDGTETTESWTWRYHPWPKRISVNPCELPEDSPDYDPDAVCPSVVPDLRGMTYAQATSALNALDLKIAQGSDVTVSDPAQVGLVQSQSPGTGTLLPPGETVTVRLGASP